MSTSYATIRPKDEARVTDAEDTDSVVIDSASGTESIAISDLRSTILGATAILTASSGMDFGTRGAGTSTTVSIAVIGAVVSNVVMLGLPSSIPACEFVGYVNIPGQVTVRCSNHTSGSISVGVLTVRVSVLQY